MIDVLFLALNDWANTGWRFFKCAQMLGLNVMGFKSDLHPFYYPEQLVIHPDIAGAGSHGRQLAVQLPDGNELNSFVRDAKIVHFIGSCCILTGEDLRNKPVVMQHGGRNYRANSDQVNTMYNEFCDATIVQTADLAGLGAKNEHLIYFPVDTNFIRPSFEKVASSKKLVIGCFATQPKDKGVDTIMEVMGKLHSRNSNFEFRHYDASRPITWLDNLERMRGCDLIVDVFSKKTSAGLDYGEWGNTAFEAAALGKAVITMSTHHDRYQAEYGDCALNIANTKAELLSTLERFVGMSPAELRREKETTRAWVEEKHGMAATSKRLAKVYQEVMG